MLRSVKGGEVARTSGIDRGSLLRRGAIAVAVIAVLSAGVGLAVHNRTEAPLAAAPSVPSSNPAAVTWQAFEDCTYHVTTDASAQPQREASLGDSEAGRGSDVARLADAGPMLNAHESLKIHEKRQLMAGVTGASVAGPASSAYALAGDCRKNVDAAASPDAVIPRER
jgi:hypothetical protein